MGKLFLKGQAQPRSKTGERGFQPVNPQRGILSCFQVKAFWMLKRKRQVFVGAELDFLITEAEAGNKHQHHQRRSGESGFQALDKAEPSG